MEEKNISQEFRLKNMREISQNELMNKKHKKVCRDSNYIEHLIILQLLDMFPFLLLVL